MRLVKFFVESNSLEFTHKVDDMYVSTLKNNLRWHNFD
jgi:hypothetical protein